MLVGASTAEATGSRDLPWYPAGLPISQPLHFGDYGGKPMQPIWALLELTAVVVLGSGPYLWLAKRRQAADASAALPCRLSAGEPPPLASAIRLPIRRPPRRSGSG